MKVKNLAFVNANIKPKIFLTRMSEEKLYIYPGDLPKWLENKEILAITISMDLEIVSVVIE